MMNENDRSDHTSPAADAAEPSAHATDAAPAIPGAAPGKQLSPEAVRALMEAEVRRQAGPRQELPAEIDGRGGEEPTRYGDWEKKGIAVDF